MSFSTSQVPTIPLRGDVEIPQLGFGVFQVPPEETAEAATRALLAGYRHIDTAAAYRNEAGVGQAVHAAGLERDDVFVTTKCFNDDHGFDQAQRALQRQPRIASRWSTSTSTSSTGRVPSQDRYVETWQGLIEAQKQGLTRAIGVSNFQPAHLERIIDETGVDAGGQPDRAAPAPAAAGPAPRARRPRDRDRGVEPAGPGPGARGPGDRARSPRPTSATPAQVVIRWHLQLGNVVIPKSVTPERIEENFDVFDFHLSDAEMAAIEPLDAGERTGPDPDTFVRPPG